MHSFLSRNVLIFPLYILLTSRVNTFWDKIHEHFLTMSSLHAYYFLPKCVDSDFE